MSKIVFNYRRKTWKETQNFIDSLEAGHALDLACGNGQETALLFKKGLEVTALDISDDLLNEAKKKAPNANFIKGDIRNIPLENDSVNYINFMAALHHLKNNNDRLKCLKEIHRCLKKDGRAFLSVWSKKGLSGGKYIPWGDNKKRYYYFFEQQELLNLIQMSGFEIIKCKNSNENIFVEFKKP